MEVISAMRDDIDSITREVLQLQATLRARKENIRIFCISNGFHKLHKICPESTCMRDNGEFYYKCETCGSGY